MSDRSGKPSFAVSTNLKNAKYHFNEAKIDTVTEFSDTIPNSVSRSTWLCVTSNMKSTSRKTWQTSLLFLELLQIQDLKRKSGGDMSYFVPPLEKVFKMEFWLRFMTSVLYRHQWRAEGVERGAGPGHPMPGGASKEWNYKDWNAVTGWFFLL